MFSNKCINGNWCKVNIVLDVEIITSLLQDFTIVFDTAPFHQQKALLHSLIKEIKPSKDINERLEEAVILRLNDLDLMGYRVDNNAEKPFEVIYDMSRR